MLLNLFLTLMIISPLMFLVGVILHLELSSRYMRWVVWQIFTTLCLGAVIMLERVWLYRF